MLSNGRTSARGLTTFIFLATSCLKSLPPSPEDGRSGCSQDQVTAPVETEPGLSEFYQLTALEHQLHLVVVPGLSLPPPSARKGQGEHGGQLCGLGAEGVGQVQGPQTACKEGRADHLSM